MSEFSTGGQDRDARPKDFEARRQEVRRQRVEVAAQVIERIGGIGNAGVFLTSRLLVPEKSDRVLAELQVLPAIILDVQVRGGKLAVATLFPYAFWTDKTKEPDYAIRTAGEELSVAFSPGAGGLDLDVTPAAGGVETARAQLDAHSRDLARFGGEVAAFSVPLYGYTPSPTDSEKDVDQLIGWTIHRHLVGLANPA